MYSESLDETRLELIHSLNFYEIAVQLKLFKLVKCAKWTCKVMSTTQTIGNTNILKHKVG